MQLESLGERCNLPSRVWGEAPAEIKFDAFQSENLTSGGTNFSFFLTFPKKKYFPLTFP